MNNLIIVLSGPSGAGKDSIYNQITSKRSNTYKYVSVTTRNRRDDEIEGIDYEYVTKTKFKELEKQEYFLETNFYDGNYYGTPKPVIEEHLDKDLFFVLNAEGGMKIKENYPDAILIYILPPDVAQLKKQRGERGKARHQLGIDEIPIAAKFDWLIINRTVDEAAKEVESILDIIRKFRMANTDNQKFLKEYY